MVGIGRVWFVGSRGSGTPVKLILLGVAIASIGSLVGTGSMITWIMGFIGVTAPVLA